MKSVKLLFFLVVSICFLFGAISIAAEKRQTPNEQYRGKNMEMPPPPVIPWGCTPTTCEEAKATCGNISDGCGKVLDCGIAKQVSVTVDPQQYNGVCPKTFKFTATITTNKKGTASYRWSHSPYVNKEGEIVFNAAGSKQVFFEWAVPHSVVSDQQWLSFSACGAEPAKASFSIHCTNLKPIGGNTSPQ